MPEQTVEVCPFQEALELLGRRHTLTLLWILQQQSPRRFTDFRRATRINPVTLSERLDELEACGIVSRRQYNETPPRVEYDLLPRGRDLLGVLDHLAAWAKTHRFRGPDASVKAGARLAARP